MQRICTVVYILPKVKELDDVPDLEYASPIDENNQNIVKRLRLINDCIKNIDKITDTCDNIVTLDVSQNIENMIYELNDSLNILNEMDEIVKSEFGVEDIELNYNTNILLRQAKNKINNLLAKL
jgi:hypothetical protein